MNSHDRLLGLVLCGAGVLLACFLFESLLRRLAPLLPYSFRRPLRLVHFAGNSLSFVLSLLAASAQQPGSLPSRAHE